MAGGIAACGSFLLFAATILLLVTCISAPVVHRISFLNIDYGGITATFGVFGYCIDEASGSCTSAGLGYPTSVLSQYISQNNWLETHVTSITRALVLHPIATGIAFLSFLVASCSERIGYLFSSLLAFLAFVVAVAALAVDFVLFTILRNEINNNIEEANASYGVAIWLTLAGTACLFVASFVVCLGCCAGRRDRAMENRYGKY